MPRPMGAMISGPGNAPGVWDWRSDFTVVNPSAKEIISFCLWERVVYTGGATTALTAFTAATSGINGNLQGAGQLPAGQFMRVQAIRLGVAVRPTTEVTAVSADGALSSPIGDVHNLIFTGTAKLTVGDKEYGRWPIFMLPGGGGVYGFLALGSTTAAGADVVDSFASNGVPDPRAVYSLPVNIGIPPQYNFRITLEWNAAVTLSTGAGATVPIFVMLDGQLMRPTQ